MLLVPQVYHFHIYCFQPDRFDPRTDSVFLDTVKQLVELEYSRYFACRRMFYCIHCQVRCRSRML